MSGESDAQNYFEI